MQSLVVLVIFIIFVGTTSAANLTVASPGEEYIASWSRKFQVDIFQANMRIECVDNRGADGIRIIKDQQGEVLREMKIYKDSLLSKEALNLTHKHCVQKYKDTLYTEQWATSRFSSCIATAQSKVDTLTKLPKSYLQDAKTNADVNFPRYTTGCAKEKDPTKYEDCIVTNATYYSNAIEQNLRNVDKNLDASLCTSTDLSRDAIKCSFQTERLILKQIGEINTKINKCVQEVEITCPCAKDLMSDNAAAVLSIGQRSVNPTGSVETKYNKS